MKELEYLLEKEKLTPEETDLLITKIKENLWPKLVHEGMPKDCGDCALFRTCKLIDKSLICPWLV